MPIIGEVPMSKYFIFLITLVFYIPECGKELQKLKKLIEENGGMTVD
jgi:hypothetical protein